MSEEQKKGNQGEVARMVDQNRDRSIEWGEVSEKKGLQPSKPSNVTQPDKLPIPPPPPKGGKEDSEKK